MQRLLPPVLVVTVVLSGFCGAAQRPADLPHYSQKGHYPDAPRAKGLPSGPEQLRRTHAGLYADYGGEFFGEGTYFIAGPQQELAPRQHPLWAVAPAVCPKMRMVALVKTGVWGTGAFDIARRLGATIASVPIAFRDMPKPPRGVRVTRLSMSRLKQALAGRVDVILVSKLIRALPVEAQQMILDKVTAGAGLVVVGPLRKDGPLMAALPVTNPGQNWDNKLRDYRDARGQGWLVGGVAFQLWPGHPTDKLKPWVDFDPRQCNMIAYTPKKGARVAATLGTAPLVITGTIGKGRVVLMGYAGNRWDGSYVPILGEGNDLELLLRAKHYEEQMYALLVKSAAYAAGGEPPVQVVWPADQQIRIKHGTTAVSVRVMNRQRGPVRVEVSLVLRDGPTWQVLGRCRRPAVLKPGVATTVSATFASIPAVTGAGGSADPLLEISVRDRAGRPLDWGTVLLTVADAPKFDCRLKHEIVYKGDPAEVELDTAVPATWQAVDTWGRVLARGSCPAGKHRLAIKPDYRSGLVTIVADGRDPAGNVLVRAVREMYTPIYDHTREYYNLLWPRLSQPWTFREANGDVLRRQGGIGVTLTGGYYQRRYSAQTPLRGGQRSAMTNMGPRAPFAELADFPDTANKNLAQARDKYTGWVGRYGPLTLHLQDERHSPRNLKELKLGPKALAAFRKWLEAEYGTIDKLNAQWRTDYNDFAQVTPVSDPLKVIAKPASYAPWLDVVRFTDREVGMTYDLKLCKLLEDETRGNITLGFEGIFGLYGGHLNPYSGVNIPLLYDSGVKMNNMAYGIGSPMWELCASLNPDAEAGTWLGYESERTVYQREPWRGVLSGATFMGWFIDSLWFTAEGAVADRLSWIEQHTRPLRQGVGRMLNESRRQFDDVAILANMRSSQMAWMVGWQMDPKGKARLGHWMLRPMEGSGGALLNICRDYGVSPAFITEGQILKDRLKHVKVLCLVYDLSIDTKVAEAIRQWVRNGGTVIADCGAGVANEHGRFLDRGQLDDVFGLKRTGPFTTVAEAGDFTVGLLTPAQELIDTGCQKGNWYMVEYYEPNLKATTAQATGSYVFGQTVPMCLWNTFGKGRALYVGFLNNRYRSDEKDRLSVFPLYASVFRRAGVVPRVKLTRDGAVPLKGYTVTNSADGPALYTGVTRRVPAAPAQVVLVYPKPGHVYEVMTNRYLGHGKAITLDLASGEPFKAGLPTVGGEALMQPQDAVSGMALAARLPYRLTGVAVTATPGKPGQPLAVRVSVSAKDAKPGRHTLFLDVRDPAGLRAEPYTMNVVTTGGVWTGTLPLALNEATGTWTLIAREAITGLTAQTKVTIK